MLYWLMQLAFKCFAHVKHGDFLESFESLRAMFSSIESKA
ncbi:hypothetical protein GGE60_002403 [Rhizobium leucaenae]|uniref:Uncharacterized protein n=1 Tax=Rhizobium leucaenae TaxID=29450 RepID=A0A7W6ZU80_9HYPH|nr:hypothetical protein [Rhizobium leucaenae]